MPAALIAATLVAVTSSSGSAAQLPPYVVKPSSADAAKTSYEPKSVLVKFKARTSSATQQKALGKAQSRVAESLTSEVVKVTSDQAAPDLLKKLKADPSVELASLNYTRKASATPNDQFYNQYQKPYLSTIRMPDAWNLSKSAGSQTVAVLDTGIDAGHPDLVGKVLAGRNVITPAKIPDDDNGHGTMTSGVIGASTNNSVGVAGVAWSAKILPVKVLNKDGAGFDSDIITGLNWAAANGARVINMSLGGDADNSLLHDAVTNAVKKGIVVVAAAGNSRVNAPEYPAAYPEVIAVGATDNSGLLTSFSTQGDWVDIAAPGWYIMAPGPRRLTDLTKYEPYWINSGTSFSSPIVAGVAALLRNKFPSYTPAQIAERLKSTARDAGPRGADPFYGAGVLDAYRALGGSWAADFWTNSPDNNEVPARATVIPNSPPTDPVTATGSIGPEGDVDWYKLTESSPRGVEVQVQSPEYDGQNRPQNFAPVVSVYDKDLNLIGHDEIATEPEFPHTVVATASAQLVAGDNFIAVRNYNGSRDGRAYTVSVIKGSGTSQPGHYWVRNASPSNYASGFPLAGKPSITFERDLDPATVTTSTVSLLNGKTGDGVTTAVDYDAATKAVTLTPAAPLQDNTPYRISVGAVQETGNATPFSGYSTFFRTVDQAPAPVTGFDATGAYTTAALKWTVPGITDFDQVIVRRNAGTTPPAAIDQGTAVYAGEASSTTATGLANATSYAFTAWVKDRSGKLSAPVSTQLIGTATTLSGSASVVNYGSAVTLSGKLTQIDKKTPVAGQKITLYGRNKNGTTWRAITWLSTSATGTFSVSYKPSVNTVVAWGYDGSSDLLGSRTGNFTIDVRPTITANLTSTSIKLGSSTSFYGYVRPQHNGSPIYLQRLIGSSWTTITSTKLNSTGNYAFGIKPAARGSYTYRTVFQADADHATAVSATKSFSVS